MTERLPHGGVGVIIVAFHSWKMLRDGIPEGALATVRQVVVADNSLDQEERIRTRALAEKRGWTYVPMMRNAGFGAGCNAAAARAIADGCDGILLLNPDARIADSDLETLVAGARGEAMVAPRILRPDGSVWFQGGVLDQRLGVARHAADAGAPDWLTGACLYLPAEGWERVGGFDERFFLYWEDVDLSARWRALGGELRIVNEAIAVHDVGGTQSAADGAKSRVYLTYNSRNRMLFAALHLRWGLAWRWLVTSPRYWRRLLKLSRLPLGTQMRVLPAIVWATFAGASLGLRYRKDRAS